MRARSLQLLLLNKNWQVDLVLLIDHVLAIVQLVLRLIAKIQFTRRYELRDGLHEKVLRMLASSFEVRPFSGLAYLNCSIFQRFELGLADILRAVSAWRARPVTD